jgi:hypothetical protein
MSAPDRQRLPGDAPMRAAIVAVALSGAGITMIALVFFGGRAAFGALVGASIATVNLMVFARVGQVFLEQRKGQGAWLAVVLLKLIFLFGGVYLLIKHEIVQGIALAAGYGALPLGITLGSLLGPKPPDDPNLEENP